MECHLRSSVRLEEEWSRKNTGGTSSDWVVFELLPIAFSGYNSVSPPTADVYYQPYWLCYSMSNLQSPLLKQLFGDNGRIV